MTSLPADQKPVTGSCLGDYEVVKVLGRGTYGKALLVSRKLDQRILVVKQVELEDLDEHEKAAALNEVAVLSDMDHVNIISYETCFTEGDTLHIVMEHATQGDLGTLIQKHAASTKPFTEQEIMQWFVQILLALWHVHGKKVLHRDLKSQNIFLTQGNLVKLGDFGIARTLNSQSQLAHTVVGTPFYLSPEICEDKPYDHKSDVWSLGCVLYELATLKRAFNGQSLPALVLKILRGKYPPLPSRYSANLRTLVDCMLKLKPQMRPSVQELLCMPYVSQYIAKYAKHIMQLSADSGRAPSLDLDKLPVIAQICRSVPQTKQPKPTPAVLQPTPPEGEHSQEPELPIVPEAAQSPDSAGKLKGRHALGPESTWAVRQSAELDGLQAAFKKLQQPQAEEDMPLEQETATAETRIEVQVQQSPQKLLTPRPIIGGAAKVTLAPTFPHNKELAKQQAAIQQERDRRKDIAAQKASGIEEVQKAKLLLRRQSMEQQRQQAEQVEAEKAAKAAAAEQAVKERHQAKLRQQEEAQQRLVAHKQGVKAAKTRINRAALQELGEAFAARLQSTPADQDAPVLFVDASVPPPTSESAADLQARQRPGRRGQQLPDQAPGCHLAGAASAPAALPEATGAAKADVLPVPGMGFREWVRQQKQAAAAEDADFPQVQVYCPDTRGKYARSSSQPFSKSPRPDLAPHQIDLETAPCQMEAASSSSDARLLAEVRSGQSQTETAASFRPRNEEAMQHDMGDNINGAEALQSNTGVTSSGAEDTEGVVGVKEHRVGIGQSVRGERTVQAGVQCSMTAKGDNEVVNNQPGSDAVIEVLADIEEVLEGELTFHHGLSGSQESSAAAAQPSAGKVENLRLSLEQQLGPTKLVEAHRYLAQIQDMQDDDINTQAVLEGILGEHIHLAHSINKLLLLENAVYP